MLVYRITACPLYPKSDAEASPWIEENLLTQRALWTALRSLLPTDRAASVEVRFVTGSQAQSIETYLIFHHHDVACEDNFLPALRQRIERLLPGEYGWTSAGPESLCSAPSVPPGGWQALRLVRRMDFFDLPTSLNLWNQDGRAFSSGALSQKGVESKGKELNPSSLVSSPASTGLDGIGESMPQWSGQRNLPFLWDDNPFNQIGYGCVCVPVLGEIESQSPDKKRLLLELLYSAPAVISFTLHSGPGLLPDETERTVATKFKRLLDPFVSPVSGAGFSSIEGLQRVYDRYWLPSHNLCHLSVRVAASDEDRARGLAHNLASQFGGLRAFEVLPDGRTIYNLAALARPDDEIRLLNKGIRGDWLRALKNKLQNSSVYHWNETAYKEFLSRMPSLYTMDEALLLLRLPYASESGLPGLPTKLIPPFYSSSPQTVAFGDPMSAKKFRIGAVKTSSIANHGVLEAGESAEKKSYWQNTRWHTMELKNLTKHALIVGSTGSGKTQTMLFLLAELHRRGVPFLIIEPVKTEYFDLLNKWIETPDGRPALRRWRFEITKSDRERAKKAFKQKYDATLAEDNDDSRAKKLGQEEYDSVLMENYLPFDPMRLQVGVSVARHASYLKSCFEAAFPLDNALSLVLESGLREYYVRPKKSGGCELDLFSTGDGIFKAFTTSAPSNSSDGPMITRHLQSFQDFRSFFLDKYLEEVLAPAQNGKPSAQMAELLITWRQIFERRFNNLHTGPLGRAFKHADDLRKGDPFAELLRGPTIVELDGISDNEQKAMAMAFLMTFLFERRQADKPEHESGASDTKPPPHVLVIEEAHRLLARDAQGGALRGETAGADSRAKSVSLFVDMLAEIRALGQGIFIVEQIPTKIVAEAVKNTNLKIMLRLTSEDDRNYLGEAMNFTQDQKRFVSTLRPLNLAVFEEDLDQPLLLEIPHSEDWKTINLFPESDSLPPVT
jgi:hypothetical protein